MTYLDLVKRLVQELHIELSTKVTTVSPDPPTAYGSTTELLVSCAQWVQQAWLEIQEDQDAWNFMVDRGRMDLVQSQYAYEIRTIVDDAAGEEIYDHIIPFVAPVDRRYIWISDGSVERAVPNQCRYIVPEHFFGFVDRSNDRSIGMPARYSIGRNGSIVFDAAPSHDGYWVDFEYKMMPHMLVADEDIPRGLPVMFHMLIVYQAMMYYSMSDEAGNQYARAEKLYKRWMNKLRLRQLGEYSMVGTRS